jgi:hypothetical protein
MLDRSASAAVSSDSFSRIACSTCGAVAPMIRLPVSSLAPGELQSSPQWLATAAVLEETAEALIRRACHGPFDRAQARATARALCEAAAEIRANLALEEMQACQMRS